MEEPGTPLLPPVHDSCAVAGNSDKPIIKMIPSHNKLSLSLAGCLLAGLTATSPGAIVQNSQSNADTSFFNGNVTLNLIQNGQSSLSSVTAPMSALNGTFSAAGLNDGSAAGNGNKCYYTVFDNGLGASGVIMPDTITFQLSSGYDITSLQVLSGWGDHNLGEQAFQVLLSINGGAFTDYGTYNNNTSMGTPGGGSDHGSYLTTLTDGTGIIASDVTGIQFVFMNPDTSNGAGSVGASQAGGGSTGGTLIYELQAFGTPTTVPEPTSVALLGLAAAGLLAGRRRLAR